LNRTLHQRSNLSLETETLQPVSNTL